MVWRTLWFRHRHGAWLCRSHPHRVFPDLSQPTDPGTKRRRTLLARHSHRPPRDRWGSAHASPPVHGGDQLHLRRTDRRLLPPDLRHLQNLHQAERHLPPARPGLALRHRHLRPRPGRRLLHLQTSSSSI